MHLLAFRSLWSNHPQVVAFPPIHYGSGATGPVPLSSGLPQRRLPRCLSPRCFTFENRPHQPHSPRLSIATTCQAFLFRPGAPPRRGSRASDGAFWIFVFLGCDSRLSMGEGNTTAAVRKIGASCATGGTCAGWSSGMRGSCWRLKQCAVFCGMGVDVG